MIFFIANSIWRSTTRKILPGNLQAAARNPAYSVIEQLERPVALFRRPIHRGGLFHDVHA